MRGLRFAGPLCLLAGVGVLGLAWSRGEATLYLVLVIPVITGTGPLALLGIVLIFLGFMGSFLFLPVLGPSSPPRDVRDVSRVPPEADTGRRWGGVVFLGPFPIVFGSDPRITRIMFLLGLVLFVALLVLTISALLA